MFCPNCGKELNNEDQFCPNCGTKIDKTDLDLYSSKPKTDEPKVSKKPLVFAIIGFILALSNLFDVFELFMLKDEYSGTEYNYMYIALSVISIIIDIVAIIFSKIGLKSDKRGLGIAGLIFGIIGLVVFTVLLVLFLV